MRPAGGAARAFFERHLARHDLHARLAERDDQLLRRRVIRHRLPVVAAFGARAHRQPLVDLLIDDVLAIGRRALLRIDLLEDVLEHGLLVAEELAGLALDLPQDAGLADREEILLRTDVDQHPLEHLVEVERFTGRVLVVPRQRCRRSTRSATVDAV